MKNLQDSLQNAVLKTIQSNNKAKQRTKKRHKIHIVFSVASTWSLIWCCLLPCFFAGLKESFSSVEYKYIGKSEVSLP